MSAAAASPSSWRLRAKGTVLHDIIGLLAVLWAWAPIVLAFAWFRYRPSILAAVVAFLVVGIRRNAIFIIVHESWHYSLFSRKKWNERIGSWLASYPILLFYRQDRELHWTHHRKVGGAGDPDRWTWDWRVDERAAWAKEFFLTSLGFRFIGPLARRVLKLPPPPDAPGRPPRPVLPPGSGLKSRDGLGIVVSQLVLLTVFSLVLHWWCFFLLWVAPLLTLGQLMLELRQFLEHRNGRLLVYRAGPVERWLFGCFNFHIHGYHHAYASEPWFVLPAISEKAMKKEPTIVQLDGYWKELFLYVAGRASKAQPIGVDGRERLAGDGTSPPAESVAQVG